MKYRNLFLSYLLKTLSGIQDYRFKIHFCCCSLSDAAIRRTRQHSSKMRTIRLPTACVLVATTRCQYPQGGGIPSPISRGGLPWDLGHPPPGHWTYSSPWTYPLNITHPSMWTDTCEKQKFQYLLL